MIWIERVREFEVELISAFRRVKKENRKIMKSK